MLENSDQVNNFDQTHEHTLREKNSHCISHEWGSDVKISSTEEQEHARYLEVVPKIFKILAALITNLGYLIDEENELNYRAGKFVEEKFEIFIS